jgi:hypothetical protein
MIPSKCGNLLTELVENILLLFILEVLENLLPRMKE